MKEKRYRSGLFAVLTLIICISVVANVIAGNAVTIGTWHNTDIGAADPDYYVHYSYTDIIVDPAGNPHIVHRGPGLDLRYTTSRNNCWSTEVVFDPVPAVARESAIALDANGLPHVSFSFSDGGGENLMYANKDITGTWHIETIYTPGSVGMESDIAVDSNGHVHIVHWRWSGGDLLYSTNLSGIWTTEEITLEASGWHKTAIGIDSNDHIHIVYSHLGALMYTNNITGTWGFTKIDNVGGNPNMAIDANDKVHISYDSGNDLNYATNISGTWVITAVVSDVNPERDHAIAVDTNDDVHISYRDTVADNLKSANNISGSWITDTVDSLVESGRSNSIAIDDSSIAHVSYRYDTNAWELMSGAGLRYANNAPEPPVCMPYLVTLGLDMASAAEVGKTVSYILTLTNEGIMTDTFDLSVTAVWTTTVSPISVTLGTNESTAVHVSVAVPAEAADGKMDVATITAVSQSDPLIGDSATLTTTAVIFPKYTFLPILRN